MVNFLKNILNKIETFVLSRKKRDIGDSDDDENPDKDESLDVSPLPVPSDDPQPESYLLFCY